ncbi:MAG: dihydrolipoyl dehydrogenase [Myxococcales bacterium]|nr:dihydrolipoyl dehydrogenase [Myxococcales bacterium]
MTTDNQFDLIVIGAGPGGYVAAIRASQLGLRVACVEREGLGGICLNWGCIPTKALLRSAEVFELMHRAAEFGLKASGVEADFAAIIVRSRDISSKISKGVAFLFKKNNITHIAGTATLLARSGVWQPHRVSVQGADGSALTYAAKHVLVATGARARPMPGAAFDDARIIDYRRAMTMPAQPKRLAVLGAGAIGVEFASFYRALGTEVTIVEFEPRLVPREDAEVSAELGRAFAKRGIALALNTKLLSATASASDVTLALEAREGGAASTLVADALLVAVGVVANTENLGLEAHGISTSRGFIVVDDALRAADGIYAIGDVIGRGLAHTASAEGVFVAEYLAGLAPKPVPYHAIPACTYCHPEVASVGMTEAAAKDAGIPLRIGKFPFKPLGKTMAAGEYPGFVKTLWHAETGELVGAHLIGPAVTDLIGEMTLAKTTEVNAESLLHTVHAHPTFAEALKEATEAALGHAIHL